MQDREPSGRPKGSPGATENGIVKSTKGSDTGSVGEFAPEATPVQPSDEPQASQLPLRPGPTVTAEEAELTQPTALYKYLLVDDNDINLKILTSFMKRLGHEFDTAVNGLEALQMYTADPGLYPSILMGKLTSPSY